MRRTQTGTTELEMREHDVREILEVFAPPERAGAEIIAVGREIKGVTTAISDADRVLIVQHGLPGDKWRILMEHKVRQLIKDEEAPRGALALELRSALENTADRERRLMLRETFKRRADDIARTAAFFVFPAGASGQYDFDLREREKDFYEKHIPQMRRDAHFTLDGLCDGFRAAALDIYERISPKAKVHMIGHSYGAVAALDTFLRFKKFGLKQPYRMHLLSPYIKPHPEAETETIQAVRNECGGKYNFQSSYDLVEDHRRKFGMEFMRALGNLQTGERVTVTIGDLDPHLDGNDATLLCRVIGNTRSELFDVIKGGGHMLESLDLKELLEK